MFATYEIICAVEVFLEDQDVTFFCDKNAIHPWIKCIEVKEYYIEKLFCFTDTD